MMKTAIPIWAVFACVLAILAMVLTSRRRAKPVWETTPGGPYTVTLTETEITCEHPKRPKETIRLDDVIEIRLVTTSEGPFQPDEWYLFISDKGGCSVPSEAKGFDQLWSIFERRFPGIDYGAIINAGTSNNQKTIWKRGSNQASKATSGPAPSAASSAAQG